VLVHIRGKVILEAALCCRSSSFLSLKRNTLKARCRSPLLMFSFKWPRGKRRNEVQ